VGVSSVSHFDLAKQGGEGQAFKFFPLKRGRTRRSAREGGRQRARVAFVLVPIITRM